MKMIKSISDANSVRIRLPRDVTRIIKRLCEHGFAAYSVGGCVRDSLLGRTPEDWDITTSARPEEVKQLFRHTVDTGLKHGTVTILFKKRQADTEDSSEEETAYSSYEVTTYRVDGDYHDGRHPDTVAFTPSLTEDLKRRDFTINAMAYAPEEGLVDIFDGKQDLKRRMIRCVGDPDARFSEDALRLLRAVRFAAQLDFTMEGQTRDAIKSHAPKLALVSKERIQMELSKLLCSPHPELLREIFELGLAEYVCGDFPLVDGERFEELKTGTLFPALPPAKKYLRYAMLVAGLSPETGERILKELKLDHDTIRNTMILAGTVLRYIPSDRYQLKKVLGTMTPELMAELLELKRLFRSTALYREHCYGEDVETLVLLFADIRRREDPVYLSDLAVRGDDLIKAGVEPGPYIGVILEAMLDDVLHEPLHNSILYLLSQHLSGTKACAPQRQQP